MYNPGWGEPGTQEYQGEPARGLDEPRAEGVVQPGVRVGAGTTGHHALLDSAEGRGLQHAVRRFLK